MATKVTRHHALRCFPSGVIWSTIPTHIPLAALKKISVLLLQTSHVRL
jgi:hypothetical protein